MSGQLDNSDVRSRQELIDFFEKFGYVVLEGREEFEMFNRYVSEYKIPTWTSTDRQTGWVTFQKRVLGSIEGLSW